MQWGITKIFSETLIIEPLPRQLDSLVLRESDTDNLSIHLLSIEMVHGYKKRNNAYVLTKHKAKTI